MVFLKSVKIYLHMMGISEQWAYSLVSIMSHLDWSPMRFIQTLTLPLRICCLMLIQLSMYTRTIASMVSGFLLPHGKTSQSFIIQAM